MGVKDAVKRLCFWQSRQFYTLQNVGGKLVEREAGPTRPKDGAEFIKGGRKVAVEAAKILWPDAAEPEPESGEAESDVVRGEKPDVGQPLEDEGQPVISERPVRVSAKRGRVTGSPFVRITPDTMPKHGLPR